MQALQGSLVAIVTPFTHSGSIDYESLGHLLEWHIKEGTNGIVSVGTTGESATLNIQEHIDVIDFTVKKVNGRIPVIAGAGANSTNEAIDLCKESKSKNADYVLLVTPYYNKPNQKGLIAHYEKIANTVDMKQILYNVPSRTACDLLPESVKILSNHNNIIGIKEALDKSQRITDLIKISKQSDNFAVFSGDDPTFLNSLELGAKGVISVAANVIPRSISEICKKASQNNLKAANHLNNFNKNLYKLLFIESNPIPVKWMLHQMGLINNVIRLPLITLDDIFHDSVLVELKKLNLL